MHEYFIVANSFAAPFVSDTSHRHVEAENPVEALSRFRQGYTHPAGLYAAACYPSADAMHKGERPLARYLSPRLAAEEKATKDLGGYTFRSLDPNSFEVDGVAHHVAPDAAGEIVVEGAR